jgi:hypothetical protein
MSLATHPGRPRLRRGCPSRRGVPQYRSAFVADTFRGVFGTTNDRSYGVDLKYSVLESTASTC